MKHYANADPSYAHNGPLHKVCRTEVTKLNTRLSHLATRDPFTASSTRALLNLEDCTERPFFVHGWQRFARAGWFAILISRRLAVPIRNKSDIGQSSMLGIPQVWR